ncbi:MAG: ADOP family duplicated permease, partial [Blastocatellia bacterium]
MPDWKQEIRQRLANLKLEPTREAAIIEELAQHLEDCYAELLAGGVTPAEAERRTRAELSGNELLARELRRVERQAAPEPIVLGTNRRTNMFADMWQDLRYGARALWNSRGFTVVAALSLALGIGATTTVFSLMNAVLLRPLPVKDADTLVSVNKDNDMHTISYPDYLDYRSRNEVFSELLVWSQTPLSLNLGDQAEQAYGMVVSGNYFSMLGAQPALGRFFSAEEDRTPGAHPVVVISFALWQSRFGANPSVIGQSVKLNGQPFTIIGVAPKGFTSTYNVFAPALYAPLMMQAQVKSQPDIFGERMSKYLKLTGRLKPGVTREQAQAALSLLDRQLEEAYPQQGRTSHRANLGLELVPVGSFPGEIRLALLGGASLLLAIAGFVLLIACANVAGMLLARATVRQREIAVRLALGATRWRLIRQLLTESSLLFCVAGALGVGLTVWLTRLLSTRPIPIAVPFAIEAKVDWRVLIFTLLLALLTGIIFGLAPAMEAARTDLHTTLKDVPSSRGVRRSRLRHAFVVGQIALSLVLLIGAGLFTRALQYGQTVYPGRDPETVLKVELDPRQQGYSVARAREFYQQLTERVATLPGVEAVSLARALQIGPGYGTTSLAVKDAPHEGNLRAEFNIVMPRYFQTLGITLLSGRDFTLADREGAPRVVIINEALQRRFWPGANALGKQVSAGEGGWAEVVGVVENGKSRLSGQTPRPLVYWPFLQSGSDNLDMNLLLRHHGDTGNLLSAVRREVQTLDPNLPAQSPMTLSEAVRLATLPWRVVGVLANVFGLIGLALAALGVYGLVSYTVNQRTHEIGVRVALGAQRRDIFKLVIGHGLKLALLGVAVGLALSFGLTRALAALLFGVSASDPVTYLGVSSLLALVALAASFIPARAATCRLV